MSVLTLFSDASFDSASGAGGWGAWAKHSSWPAGVLFGGPMKLLMGSSSDAEITAISTALHRLPRLGAFGNTRTVMVQSDSVRALGLMAAWIPDCGIVHGKNTAEIRLMRENLTEYEGRAIAAIRILAMKYVLAFQLSHVRAHSTGPGSSPMNRKCDKLARSAMRDHRKLLTPPDHRPRLPSNEDASGVLEMMVRAFGAEIGRDVNIAGGGEQPSQMKSVAQKESARKQPVAAPGGVGKKSDGKAGVGGTAGGQQPSQGKGVMQKGSGQKQPVAGQQPSQAKSGGRKKCGRKRRGAVLGNIVNERNGKAGQAAAPPAGEIPTKPVLASLSAGIAK